MKHYRLKTANNAAKEKRKDKGKSGAQANLNNAYNVSFNKREIAYAGIYGSSLINADKSVLKNMGLSGNKYLDAQQLRNQGIVARKRKASKQRAQSNSNANHGRGMIEADEENLMELDDSKAEIP